MAAESRRAVQEQELLPELFWAADGASLQGQRRTVTMSRFQLILLTAAAVAGSADEPWIAALSAVLFFLAMCASGLANLHNPQGLWYEGRAVAESVKTLVWKYAVRADAQTPPPTVPGDAESLYRLQLTGVLAVFRRSRAVPPGAGTDVTEAMRRLRDAPLAVRRDVYLRERVRNQHDWYVARARACDRAARVTGCLSVALPLLGVVLAVPRIQGDFSYDVLGAVAALAASATAWSQLRQYRPLAAAYRLAADELELVRVQLAAMDLSAPDAEEQWSRLARDAEDAVSREHTTWQARREVRG
ncbi:DUF4231 domain-containing protein [Peterkaempfera bronchialis]|uniref:DUF4231 domain-containing protein n=1 Tax=Peterkaempfera bronchialis TaxID=2126346 RepID=A0A345SWP1_9ACTN|nr:DUF4231 domain-containing protein [Peterkaempfera bronchialis]AXI78146.1 DUF4231 domain-containing protein [Peterkaempfera bronchialis]